MRTIKQFVQPVIKYKTVYFPHLGLELGCIKQDVTKVPNRTT